MRRSTWIQSAHDGSTWFQSAHDGSIWIQSVHDGRTWFQSAHDGSTWIQPAHDGNTWIQSAHDRSTWIQSAHDGSTWIQSAHDGSTWIQPAHAADWRGLGLSVNSSISQQLLDNVSLFVKCFHASRPLAAFPRSFAPLTREPDVTSTDTGRSTCSKRNHWRHERNRRTLNRPCSAQSHNLNSSGKRRTVFQWKQ